MQAAGETGSGMLRSGGELGVDGDSKHIDDYSGDDKKAAALMSTLAVACHNLAVEVRHGDRVIAAALPHLKQRTLLAPEDFFLR